MKLLQCDLWPTWFISSIPLLANSNTSSVGCTAVVMALGFSGSQLGLLLLPLSLSPRARTLGTPLHQTGVFFRALVVWSGRSELRERTRARFQKSSGRLVPRWSWGWVLWTSTPWDGATNGEERSRGLDEQQQDWRPLPYHYEQRQRTAQVPKPASAVLVCVRSVKAPLILIIIISLLSERDRISSSIHIVKLKFPSSWIGLNPLRLNTETSFQIELRSLKSLIGGRWFLLLLNIIFVSNIPSTSLKLTLVKCTKDQVGYIQSTRGQTMARGPGCGPFGFLTRPAKPFQIIWFIFYYHYHLFTSVFSSSVFSLQYPCFPIDGVDRKW